VAGRRARRLIRLTSGAGLVTQSLLSVPEPERTRPINAESRRSRKIESDGATTFWGPVPEESTPVIPPATVFEWPTYTAHAEAGSQSSSQPGGRS
jgi:hypothetical protein